MFHRQTVVCLCIGATLWIAGCASVKVKRVPSGEGGSVEGLRFYRPVPYLMVSEASNESKQSQPTDSSPQRMLQFTIVWMPDMSQEYAIQASPGLGSIEFNPTLENGWNLTGLNTKMDSKTAELVTAMVGVAGLLPKAAAVAPGKVAGVTSVKPGMYPFLFEQNPKSPSYGRLKGIDLEHPVFTIPQ